MDEFNVTEVMHDYTHFKGNWEKGKIIEMWQIGNSVK